MKKLIAAILILTLSCNHTPERHEMKVYKNGVGRYVVFDGEFYAVPPFGESRATFASIWDTTLVDVYWDYPTCEDATLAMAGVKRHQDRMEKYEIEKERIKVVEDSLNKLRSILKEVNCDTIATIPVWPVRCCSDTFYYYDIKRSPREYCIKDDSIAVIIDGVWSDNSDTVIIDLRKINSYTDENGFRCFTYPVKKDIIHRGLNQDDFVSAFDVGSKNIDSPIVISYRQETDTIYPKNIKPDKNGEIHFQFPAKRHKP